jgi:putative IMPACT (imprinted ancient) family translation regulator
VTRYFGGTKLGVGGLMRAYGGAAGLACDRATVRTVVLTRTLRITHPYTLSGPVQGVLTAYAFEAQDAVYAEDVAFTVDVPLERAEAFLAELRERTADRARVVES